MRNRDAAPQTHAATSPNASADHPKRDHLTREQDPRAPATHRDRTSTDEQAPRLPTAYDASPRRPQSAARSSASFPFCAGRQRALAALWACLWPGRNPDSSSSSGNARAAVNFSKSSLWLRSSLSSGCIRGWPIEPLTTRSGNARTARSNLSNSSRVRQTCPNSASSPGFNTNDSATDVHSRLPGVLSPVGGFVDIATLSQTSSQKTGSSIGGGQI
jgi:hypothetical protein